MTDIDKTVAEAQAWLTQRGDAWQAIHLIRSLLAAVVELHKENEQLCNLQREQESIVFGVCIKCRNGQTHDFS